MCVTNSAEVSLGSELNETRAYAPPSAGRPITRIRGAPPTLLVTGSYVKTKAWLAMLRYRFVPLNSLGKVWALDHNRATPSCSWGGDRTESCDPKLPFYDEEVLVRVKCDAAWGRKVRKDNMGGKAWSDSYW